MIRLLTDEESAASNARIAELWRSNQNTDKIAAILMDPGIGGTGLFEAAAQMKAREILKSALAGSK